MFDGIDISAGSGGGAGRPSDRADHALCFGSGTEASPLRIAGVLDADAARRLRERFSDLARTAQHDVVIDLSGVGYLDGAGLGALSFLFRHLATRRRRLAIVGANGQPLGLLKELGLAKTLGVAQRRRPVRLFGRAPLQADRA